MMIYLCMFLISCHLPYSRLHPFLPSSPLCGCLPVAELLSPVVYFAPRSTQPSIPPGSVNHYQLRLGRQRQVWLIPIADERVGVQVKL